MSRYFSDLDDGKTKYVDRVGTELLSEAMVEREALGFLAQVFKDAAPDEGDRIFTVSVRNEAQSVVFTTVLTLQSDWIVTSKGVRGDVPSVS
jgi:hypothetical protein